MNLVPVKKLPNYLRSPHDDLWQWCDNDKWLAWNSGASIALAEQVSLLLDQLHKRLGGLPSLTALLFVIEACTDRWDKPLCEERIHWLTQRAMPRSRTIHIEICHWLKQIHELAPTFRGNMDSVVAVITYAMQESSTELLDIAETRQIRDILAWLSAEMHDKEDQLLYPQTAKRLSHEKCEQALKILSHMSTFPVDANKIRLWRETNLVALPERAKDFDPPQSKNAISEAIKELTRNTTWGGVARAGLAASTVLSLPRRPSDPDQLPIGGVSDITNRGDPERLLITELAQDPMVMLARIANGQALYLRREVPPGPSPPVRPVLMETGIRTWGQTRLTIASVGMAIAAAEERRGESRALMISVYGSESVEEDFSETDGMIAHLSRTPIDEHPGQAMASWFERMDESDESFADPILVVSAATDSDPRFRQCLQQIPDDLLVIQVHSDERAVLIRRTKLGDEILQSMEVKDDQPKQVSKSRRPPSKISFQKPLFVDVQPSPLRFTFNNDDGWVAPSDKGVFKLTKDRRLLFFGDAECGGIELLDYVVDHRVLAFEVDGLRIALVVGDNDESFLVEADGGTGDASIVRLEGANERASFVSFDDGNLFRFGNLVTLYDRQTGQICDQQKIYRPFIGAAVCAAIPFAHLYSSVAGKITTHDFRVDVTHSHLGMACRDAENQIALVTNNWTQIIRLTDSKPLMFSSKQSKTDGHLIRCPRILYRSADGNTVVTDQVETPTRNTQYARASGQKRTFYVDLKSNLVKTVYNSFPSMIYQFDNHLVRMTRSRSFLKKVSGIELVGNQIGLRKQQKRWLLYHEPNYGRLRLKLQNQYEIGESGRPLTFNKSERLEREFGSTGWSLRPIKLGSNQIVMDSRGLLHLRRGDDGTEVTLALCTDLVSGWTSWGERFGSQYWLGDRGISVSNTVTDWLEEFGKQCRQYA